MSQLKVYLSGHMPKPGEMDWREYLKGFMYYKDKEPHGEVDIVWLEPKSTSTREVRATRDLWYMNECDMAVILLDLSVGKCLGSMLEMGYLVANHKPIILINRNKDYKPTWFIEHNASVTVETLQQAVDVLKDLTGRK